MKNPESDEIDLVELAVNVTRFFRRNILEILVFIALGILMSIVIGFSKSDVIQSKMVLFSDLLTKAHCEQMGKNLNSIIWDKDRGAFTQLGLSAEEADEIHFIDIEYVPERQSDLEFEKSTILVTAELSNRQLLPKLQGSILYYFHNNPFVKVRVENRKRFYQKIIAKIDLEIASMDSIKQLYLSGRTPVGKPGVAFADPSLINKNIVEMYHSQLKYKNALEVVDSIQVVEGFTSIEKPQRLKTSLLILFGFLGGLFASLFYIGGSWILKQSSSPTP